MGVPAQICSSDFQPGWSFIWSSCKGGCRLQSAQLIFSLVSSTHRVSMIQEDFDDAHLIIAGEHSPLAHYPTPATVPRVHGLCLT